MTAQSEVQALPSNLTSTRRADRTKLFDRRGIWAGRLLGGVIAAIGAVLAAGGLWLILLGGSLYYLMSGIGYVVVGMPRFGGRRRPVAQDRRLPDGFRAAGRDVSVLVRDPSRLPAEAPERVAIPTVDLSVALPWLVRRAAISAARGLPDAAPYFIDAEAIEPAIAGAPVGGMTVVTFANNHLQYALTSLVTGSWSPSSLW